MTATAGPTVAPGATIFQAGDVGRTLLAVVERSPDALVIVDRERRLN
jgi:hypothetical protein